MWHLILTTLQAQTPDRWPNENVLPDSFPSSDSPAVPESARSSDLYLKDRAGLLSELRSSCRQWTRRERLDDRKAFRREWRRTKRCRSDDRHLCREFVRA